MVNGYGHGEVRIKAKSFWENRKSEYEQNTAEFKNLMSLRGPIFKAAATFNKFQT